MAERVLPAEDLEQSLRIDPDDLDSCLVEQPGLFYHVAENVSAANSARDAIKLELEETQAEIDQQLRKTAAQRDEKITEMAIQNQIRTAPRIKALQRRYLEARTAAENRAALKEAYQQRSFMLRELVALQLAQFQTLQVERGVVYSRHRMGEQNRDAVQQLRRDRRASK